MKAPAKLGKAGRALWRAIVAEVGEEGLELDRREVAWLTSACRCADDIAALEEAIARDGVTGRGSMGQATANPLLREVRLLRDLQGRLLARIELSGADESPASRRARKAASARVARQVALRDVSRRGGANG